MPNAGSSQPNFLFIICDQLRADHVGFGGNSDVRTPNLDKLAAESVQFDKAYVANPTCMPNRASLLTGRWPSSHGTRTNGIPVDEQSVTFVEQLADDDYQTFAVGKLHHQNMGWDYEPEQISQLEEFTPELLDDDVPDAVQTCRQSTERSWENFQLHAEKPVRMPDTYYGYQSVDLIIGHGDTPGGHWQWWAREQGVEPNDATRNTQWLDGEDAWEQVYTSDIPASAHPTAFVGEFTEKRLRQAAESEDPFFLFMSFPDPHHPFAPPKEYARRYDTEDVELPRGFWQDHKKSPAHLKHWNADRGQQGTDPTMAFSVTEEQYRKALAAQYGLIEFIDEQIGRARQVLEETGQAENTIIVFTSDHGDMFGDHGLMLKHFVHYDAVTRVPLLWFDPMEHHEPATTTALVSTVDIPATILHRAHIKTPVGHQGKDFSPVLRGEASAHRPAVLIEEEQVFSPEGLPVPTKLRTVVTPQGRMTRYFGSAELEVYDHVRDPNELDNVAGEPAARQLESDLNIALLTAMAEADATSITPIDAA